MTNLPGAAGVPMRDLPLLFRCRDRVVPGFALETLALALRLAPSEVSVEIGSHVQLGDRLRLPIDPAGSRPARPRGRSASVNRLSLDDLPLLVVGLGDPGGAWRRPGGCAAGWSSSAGRTSDARTLRLPGGHAISPAEAFAWAAASLEETPATRRASAWWDAGIIAVWARAGPWAFGRGASRRSSALRPAAATRSSTRWRRWPCSRTGGSGCPCALPLGLAVLIGALDATLRGTA